MRGAGRGLAPGHLVHVEAHDQAARGQAGMQADIVGLGRQVKVRVGGQGLCGCINNNKQKYRVKKVIN